MTAAMQSAPSMPALAEVKFQPFAPPAASIPRPHLVRLLTERNGPGVISLIAPPGYGKTTLLAQWAAAERRPVAWVTLDRLDNDPSLLFAYIATAFSRIGEVEPSLLGRLTFGDRLMSSAVPRLASNLHTWVRPAILILDEVHQLVDRRSLDVVVALMDTLPGGFRIAVAGRTSPALPLARLRAQRRLLEVDTALLALDERETGALAAATGRPLTDKQTRELMERTEGWAAGIYLATLARDRAGTGIDGLADVSGGEGYIAAYLRSEVGEGLSEDDVGFLARTSVLETVMPPVAEALTGTDGAAPRLRRLAAENLLIQEVGSSGSTYRYHHLLRDYLRNELVEREPGRTPELHRMASTWFAGAGQIEVAVEHALAGGDLDAAARLCTRAGVTMANGGRTGTLERWFASFGPGDFDRYPPLAVTAAWFHLFCGRGADADRMADIVDRATFDGQPADGTASFASQAALLRGMMARHGPARMLADAMVAVDAEGPDSWFRALSLMLAGTGHMLLGEVDKADARYSEAAEAAVVAPAAIMVALAMRASMRIREGDWRTAEELIAASREMMQAVRYDGLVPVLIVYAVSARLAIHSGDLQRAREELVRAQLVRPLANHGAPWISVAAQLELARAYLALSDPAGANAVLREAEQIVRRRPALGVLTSDLVDLRTRLAGVTSTLAGSSTLTSAELRVLPFLPTYLSFQEIADRLLISRNTVKTHAMSIYGKLWASSRGEAVERAVELGLLEPYPGLETRKSAGSERSGPVV